MDRIEVKKWTEQEQREHRALWCAGLRSGNYEQGRNKLRTADGGLCCLGVACEVSGLGKWADGGYVVDDQVSITALPPQVRDWLGLRNIGARYGSADWLTNDNDTKRLSFCEIADIIESEPDGLIAKAGA